MWFDPHSKCMLCEKGHYNDPYIQGQEVCEYLNVLTPDQVFQLSTLQFKLGKEKGWTLLLTLYK